MFRKVVVQGDGNCFFHCLTSASPRNADEWRKAIALELLCNDYFDCFFDEHKPKNAHVEDLLKGAWATNHEVMAAAWLLKTPIVVYRVNGGTTIVRPPEVDVQLSPIYVELDETSVPHYDLLVRDEATDCKTLDSDICIDEAICRSGRSSYR